MTASPDPTQPEIVARSTLFPRWKRVFDSFCIFFSLPITLPLMLFISIGILLSSGGSIFFRQERIGLLGQPFSLIKFRTMRQGSDSATHRDHARDFIQSNQPMSKLDSDDARIFAFGRFLRRFGLDELPQILNVLSGDMSLVGPRPCLRYEYEQYLPHHRKRLESPPGITGLWQVSGKNRMTFEEMVQTDVEYITQISLTRDVCILLKTIPSILMEARLEKRPK